MARHLGPIAQEIEGAIANLLDPKTKWVQGEPQRPRESCAVYRFDSNTGRVMDLLSYKGLDWLERFVNSATLADHPSPFFGGNITEFNDTAQRKEQVWLMLEEALDEAISEGV